MNKLTSKSLWRGVVALVVSIALAMCYSVVMPSNSAHAEVKGNIGELNYQSNVGCDAFIDQHLEAANRLKSMFIDNSEGKITSVNNSFICDYLHLNDEAKQLKETDVYKNVFSKFKTEKVSSFNVVNLNTGASMQSMKLYTCSAEGRTSAPTSGKDSCFTGHGHTVRTGNHAAGSTWSFQLEEFGAKEGDFVYLQTNEQGGKKDIMSPVYQFGYDIETQKDEATGVTAYTAKSVDKYLQLKGNKVQALYQTVFQTNNAKDVQVGKPFKDANGALSGAVSYNDIKTAMDDFQGAKWNEVMSNAVIALIIIAVVMTILAVFAAPFTAGSSVAAIVPVLATFASIAATVSVTTGGMLIGISMPVINSTDPNVIILRTESYVPAELTNI